MKSYIFEPGRWQRIFFSHEVILDNEIHELKDPAPMLRYVASVPDKLYKGRQFFDHVGRHTMQWIVWYRYDQVFSAKELEKRNLNGHYICLFNEATLHGEQMHILKRAFHVKQDVSDVPIEAWKNKNHQGLVGEVTIVYLAK